MLSRTPSISSQPPITNSSLKHSSRTISNFIFINIFTAAAACVSAAAYILKFPLVLQHNKNVVQNQARPNPALRSQMIIAGCYLDGDCAQGTQAAF